MWCREAPQPTEDGTEPAVMLRAAICGNVRSTSSSPLPGRGSGERVIDCERFAADRTVDLARGFPRFDHGGFRALSQPLADRRQLDIDDVAQLRLRIGRDPDLADIAVEPDPFMVLGVSHVEHPLTSRLAGFGRLRMHLLKRDGNGAARTASARSWRAVPCPAPAR